MMMVESLIKRYWKHDILTPRNLFPQPRSTGIGAGGRHGQHAASHVTKDKYQEREYAMTLSQEMAVTIALVQKRIPLYAKQSLVICHQMTANLRQDGARGQTRYQLINWTGNDTLAQHQLLVQGLLATKHREEVHSNSKQFKNYVS